MKAMCLPGNPITEAIGEACYGVFGLGDVASDLYTHVPEQVLADDINKLPGVQI
jgi:hypothetical protein